MLFKTAIRGRSFRLWNDYRIHCLRRFVKYFFRQNYEQKVNSSRF